MEPSASAAQHVRTALAEVDVEHQLQVRLVEALRRAVADRQDRSARTDLLQQLEDASNVHFMSEELLMRLHAWERYEEHTEEHGKLLEELRTLRTRFEQDGDEGLDAALDLLQAWLARHIRGLDRDFAAFVASSRPGAPAR